jgi:hypothetical protein
MTQLKLDAFTRAYIECALWSSADDGGEPLDGLYSVDDIADEAIASMAEDCRQFQSDNASDLAGWGDEQGGHDFWLTRNGHGAGFWDRYSEGEMYHKGRRLTDASKAWGSSDLYVGDDGMIHVL